jgi:hypothetical protein
MVVAGKTPFETNQGRLNLSGEYLCVALLHKFQVEVT